ncbi:hypothetical protein HELRODRAFT_159623 [Helobdella robusta]|uniref:Alpha/beta hydrolase fold-3 domain-containing protein n=1 Tax=Helobdella robusta TaxID=6412 RepID=T1EP92_HELRO|nr:hypothetical protein HELRODRAFT_159623 [Helobdella robusta]ESO13027.1 hypothetical protein HELRODRAFT_159623 [Helobdella robusta]
MYTDDDYERYIEELRSKSFEEIDFEISPSRWTRLLPADKVVQSHIDLINEASDNASKVLKIEENIKYGPSDKQAYDIVTNDGVTKKNPVFVFFHGGYWQALRSSTRQQYHYIGRPIVSKNATYVSVGYNLAPNVSLTEMVKQASVAISSIVKYFVALECSNIYLCGHSAGAHLALTSTTTCDDLPFISQYIKGFVLLSGIFDARPVYESSENKILHMTREESCEISPLVSEKHIKNLAAYLKHAAYFIVAAEQDPPLFKRESLELYRILQKEKFERIEFSIAEGMDHFNLVERLIEPEYFVTKKILKTMGLEKDE